MFVYNLCLICVDIVDGGKTKFIAEQISFTKFPSIEFPDKLFNALALHKCGEHNKAFDIYLERACGGSQIACFNLGNCFIFGVGVECDVMTGLSFWMNGGSIKDEDVELMRILSNFKYMGRNEIDLSGLFHFLLFDFTFHYSKQDMTSHVSANGVLKKPRRSTFQK